MKVLIIGPFPEPINGCSYANKVLFDNLIHKGDSVKKINTSTQNLSSSQGTNFSILKALSFIKVYLEAYKVINSNVVYLTPGQTFFGVLKYAPFILLSILFKKPYVIHVHGNYLATEYQMLKGIKKRIFKFLLKNASAGIVLSELLKGNFKNLLDDSKVFIVKNFVGDNLINAYSLEKKFKDIPRILYLSNLMSQKGILDLLEALVILQNEGVEFTAKLAGNIENSILNEVQEKLHILKDHISFLGLVKGDQKIKILLDSNIFILPTYYVMEGQPISILEAMATGNIIVTTPHAGIPDIIDSKNGFFVETKNPRQIADCLTKISQNLSDNVLLFSDYNANYAKVNFTELNFSNAILNILKAIK